MNGMTEEYIPGLVSFIEPTFNRAHMIFRALDSVLAQAYRPIELIVVEDGSTDDTQPVPSAWSKKHKIAAFNVKLILQSNQGAQVAHNRGLSESSGERAAIHEAQTSLPGAEVEYLPTEKGTAVVKKTC